RPSPKMAATSNWAWGLPAAAASRSASGPTASGGRSKLCAGVSSPLGAIEPVVSGPTSSDTGPLTGVSVEGVSVVGIEIVAWEKLIGSPGLIEPVEAGSTMSITRGGTVDDWSDETSASVVPASGAALAATGW